MNDLLKPIRNQNVKDDASAAIDGLLPSPLTEKLRAMETLRSKAKEAWFGRGEEIRILRAMVAELALEYQGVDNQRAGEKVRAASTTDFTRLVGNMQQVITLQKLLRDRYRPDFETWEKDGQTLLAMAIVIIQRS